MTRNTSFEKVGELARNFVVPLDPTTDLPVSGLTRGSFTVRLWNPLGIDVSGSMAVTVEELEVAGTGIGIYRVTFRPNIVGTWNLVMVHATYLPWGKRAEYRVFDALYYVENEASIVEPFTVLSALGVPQPNVPVTEFVARLWNPSLAEVSATVPVTIRELGGGDYEASYAANATGKWMLALTHPTWFAHGKYGDRRYTSDDTTVIDVVTAIRNLIVADTDMRARLGTYQFTSGVSTPAVFTLDVIPEDSPYPAVIVNRIGGVDLGTRGREGEETLVSIRLYGDKDRRADVLRRTANVLRRLVNRAELTVTDGYRAFRCVADPPSVLSDPDGFPGYVITVRVMQIEGEV